MQDTSKYDYNRFGAKGKRVGQAVLDILQKPYEEVTCEDIIHECIQEFEENFHKAVDKGVELGYSNPFYVFVLQHKEMWADNIVRNWFIPRQTPVHASYSINQYPNHNKILYMVDPNAGKIKICWNIPGYQDCISILKKPESISIELINWIKDALAGKLDCESYKFD